MPFTIRAAEEERYLSLPYIIVNGGPRLSGLVYKHMSNVFPSIDEDAITKDLLRALQQEKEAAVEIGYSCMSIVADACAENSAINATILGRILIDFGTHLLSEMRSLGMYHNGYLNWRFDRRVGGDIVLRRQILDLDVA